MAQSSGDGPHRPLVTLQQKYKADYKQN